ncbi:hypothetical protein GCM10011487_55870 [Steroidobacter agaridevorans]|uniref:Uncharacterized protein n=1 Tax=Steroidobacter agaridevorans TaxID=2695856 RepID=A0A829YJQ4_9GAMM|nr:hypothetical protein [Steroidobacter agaridevorans]GFE83587.1 hypothetical protein GCM10011487_55870 [Steroidobacter agaridevorans]GFE86531.1 hypothetical protein GCM10011488_14850 [Steroidobacter agaridevorans]
MRILKPVVYLLAAIGLAFVALNLYLSSGLVRSCDVDSLTTVVSPDGQREARLRIVTCNYESSPMVTLSLSRQSTPKVEHSTRIGVATSTELDLTWLSNEDLRLSYPESFVLASTAPFLDGVEIQFSPKKIVRD